MTESCAYHPRRPSFYLAKALSPFFDTHLCRACYLEYLDARGVLEMAHAELRVKASLGRFI